MTTMTDIPRVWVGCLACYNDGTLTGRWIDADEAGDLTTEELHESEHVEIDPDYGPHEELWCMDHEGFGGFLSGECSPSEAQRIAEAIETIDEDQRDAVAAWLDHRGETLSEWDAPTRTAFEDAYRGAWDSIENYARDYAEELGYVDDDSRWPHYCIDWERAARELAMDLVVLENPAGGVFVFSQ